MENKKNVYTLFGSSIMAMIQKLWFYVFIIASVSVRRKLIKNISNFSFFCLRYRDCRVYSFSVTSNNYFPLFLFDMNIKFYNWKHSSTSGENYKNNFDPSVDITILDIFYNKQNYISHWTKTISSSFFSKFWKVIDHIISHIWYWFRYVTFSPSARRRRQWSSLVWSSNTNRLRRLT